MPASKSSGDLLATGLHRVFISLGADGVFAADHTGSSCPPLPGTMVNTTGCGDASHGGDHMGLFTGHGPDGHGEGGAGRLRHRHGVR